MARASRSASLISSGSLVMACCSRLQRRMGKVQKRGISDVGFRISGELRTRRMILDAPKWQQAGAPADEVTRNPKSEIRNPSFQLFLHGPRWYYAVVARVGYRL